MSSFKILNGSDRPSPEGRMLGEIAPDTKLTATIQAPAAKTQAEIRKLIEKVTTGKRRPFTPRQLERVLGARADHVSQITKEAETAGLTVEERTQAHRSHGNIPVSGTYSDFQRFSPGLQLFEYVNKKGKKFFGRQGGLKVKKGTPIVGLYGLDDRHVAHTNLRRHKSGKQAHNARPIPAGLTSRGLAKLQGWDVAGMDKTVRVTAYVSLGGDNEQIQNDLRTVAKAEGIPVPKIIIVLLGEAKNGSYSDNATVENILDMFAHALLNPNGYVIVFVGENDDDAFSGAFEELNVYPGVKVDSKTLTISAASVSWGMPASATTLQSKQRRARAAQGAQLVGLDVINATGDNGPNDNTQAPTADDPSDIPGYQGGAGIGIKSSDGVTVTAIEPWDDTASSGGETGFGISDDFPPMDQEKSLNLPVSASSGKPGHSASFFSDIAQPASGPTLHYNNQDIQVGGTSHSAPFLAAKQSYLKVKYGITSFLDFGYKNGPQIVDRITTGDASGPYPSDPSRPYNVQTGFGVLNDRKVAGVIKANKVRKSRKGRKSTGRKSTGRKSTGRKSTGRKSTGRKSTGRKSTGRRGRQAA